MDPWVLYWYGNEGMSDGGIEGRMEMEKKEERKVKKEGEEIKKIATEGDLVGSWIMDLVVRW